MRQHARRDRSGGEDEALAAAWMAAMRRGDFARAWEISDRVLARNVAAGPSWSRPRHLQWIWDGRPFDGRRVLVRCYHGLGDTIQFARFFPLMAARASSLLIWAPAALIPLLATQPGTGELLPLHDGVLDAQWDVELESMELAHALRVTPRTLPARVPYLHVPPAPRLGPQLSVGVVGRAGDWDPARSIAPDLLARLADVPGAQLFSLQPGACVPGAVDASDDDLSIAAARVQAMDLVVTADTMMAHLAGALAVPTWVLLPTPADWRWMVGRATSPWYPTVRLFRQPRPGDWEPVVEAVLARLRRQVDRARARCSAG